MRLLVTGGSGFLGRYVLREAARRRHETVALARSEAAAALVAGRGAQPLDGDLDQPDALPAIFASARCDVLVNLASLGFGHAPAIVAAAEHAGLKRGVFVSTTAITTTLPAPTKRIRLAAEEEIRSSGLDWTILRPTMIYGAPGDRNLSRLLALLTRAPVLPVPGRRHLQQPVHASDLAEAVLAAAERSAAAGQSYDVAGPVPLTFDELLRISARAVGSTTRFVPVPLAPLIALARCYEQLSQHPRIKAEQLERLAEDKAFRIDDAVRDLDYAPRPFEDGIALEAALMNLAPWRDWRRARPMPGLVP
ncbi:MAG: SDR family oxidoreductase [Streptosporangiaceae bacterium]